MDEFAWQKQEAILYNNAFFAGLAILAIVTFVTIKFVTKWCVGALTTCRYSLKIVV